MAEKTIEQKKKERKQNNEKRKLKEKTWQEQFKNDETGA